MPFGIEIGLTIGGRTTAMGYGASDGVRDQFTGQHRDTETGLDFFQARYYSNSHGRFLSADPLLASADPRRPQTWNRYSYVLNNPLKLIDPSGMSEQHPSPEDSSTDLHGSGGGGALTGGAYKQEEERESTEAAAVETATSESLEHELGHALTSDNLDSTATIGVVGGDSMEGGGFGAECFAQLKYRPTSEYSEFNHAFWWVQDKSGKQWIISGGTTDPMGEGFLDVWVTAPRPHDPELKALVLFDSGLSPTVCQGVDDIILHALAWPKGTIPYYYKGPNSNSAARYFGEVGGFPVTGEPGKNYGWNVSLPGLKR
jgi:RHS repeat-associated protein